MSVIVSIRSAIRSALLLLCSAMFVYCPPRRAGRPTVLAECYYVKFGLWHRLSVCRLLSGTFVHLLRGSNFSATFLHRLIT